MNKQSVISLLRKAKQPLSQSCGVKQLGLFGSTVRESNTESSDVDILIDFEDDKETYSNFLLACEILEKLDASEWKRPRSALFQRSDHLKCRKSAGLSCRNCLHPTPQRAQTARVSLSRVLK